MSYLMQEEPQDRITLNDCDYYCCWREAGGALVPYTESAVTVGSYELLLAADQNGRPTYEFNSNQKLHGLKLFEVSGGRLYSTYHRKPVEYREGRIYRQRVSPKIGNRDGAGYYFYLTQDIDHFMYAFDKGLIVNAIRGQQYAVSACEAMGPFIAYDARGTILPNSQIRRAKKLAASWLRINQLVHTFNY